MGAAGAQIGQGLEVGVERPHGRAHAGLVPGLTQQGGLGLILAWLGLLAVRQQPAGYADLAHMDLKMLLATFALAIIASLLAGMLPAWRAMQVTPAIQLKSQ